MKQLTVQDAFQIARPRRAAVLCIKGKDGGTDMILAQWFTWLNFHRQPMISYALDRRIEFGLSAQEGQKLCLAFLPAQGARDYADGVHVCASGESAKLPKGVSLAAPPELPMQIPAGCEAVLECTLAGAYNYPFRKTRIFNCNLDNAYGADEA